jgi:transcriptional regulator with XRE-family HTH domain
MARKDDVRLALRRAREHLGLDQGQFADALGKHLGRAIPRSQISDWERGRHEPGATILIAAAELAGRSVDELLTGSSGPLAQRVDQLADTIEEIREELARLRVLADWARQMADVSPDQLSATSDRLGRLEQAVRQLSDEIGRGDAAAKPRRSTAG